MADPRQQWDFKNPNSPRAAYECDLMGDCLLLARRLDAYVASADGRPEGIRKRMLAHAARTLEFMRGRFTDIELRMEAVRKEVPNERLGNCKPYAHLEQHGRVIESVAAISKDGIEDVLDDPEHLEDGPDD
jgi:hypothetical protein